MSNKTAYIALRRQQPGRVTSKDFVEWAELDIKAGGRRGIANAVTNAKRALHSEIDRILDGLRVAWCSDWPAVPSTEDKIAAVKKVISLPAASVALLTSRRNDLEHDYRLPTQQQAQADVEVAAMSLEAIVKQHVPVLLLGGLSVAPNCGSRSGPKEMAVFGNFDVPGEVVFFNDAKKLLVSVDRQGAKSERPYRDLPWKEFIRIQQKNTHGARDYYILKPAAPRILRAYEKWLSGSGPAAFEVAVKSS